MRAAGKVCLVVLLTTALIAQTESAKPKKAKAAPITAADVQALRDAHRLDRGNVFSVMNPCQFFLSGRAGFYLHQ